MQVDALTSEGICPLAPRLVVLVLGGANGAVYKPVKEAEGLTRISGDRIEAHEDHPTAGKDDLLRKTAEREIRVSPFHGKVMESRQIKWLTTL